MIRLDIAPFFLDNSAIEWVENTYARMTTHEKVCQLFVDPLVGKGREELLDFLDQYPICGMSFRGAQFPLEETQDILRNLQQQAKIPYLIACDTERGADKAIRGGTFIATAAQAGAADDPNVAYHVTAAAATEIAAVGYNWSFGAVCDPLLNWRNSVINTRSYSSNPDKVIQCCERFIQGFSENSMVTCIKHFPGDGWEERDQHLVIGNNGLSCIEWEQIYGKIYRHFIKSGVHSIMVGHFTLPAYQKSLNPELRDEELLPASLSSELIEGLLRKKLGFNGLVFTDQTMMMGYYAMRRTEALVQTIASGIDVILGINDIEEDVSSIMQGIKDGRISKERLKDAVYRILATKACIGLHRKQFAGTLVPSSDALSIVGCEKYKKWAIEASDSSITLVKDIKQQLPIRPDTHRRLFVNFLGNSVTKNAMGVGVTSGGTDGVREYVKSALEKAGFEVHMHQENGFRSQKGKTREFAQKYDAALIFADYSGFATQNTIRINWGSPLSSGCPWYAHEVPTAFISLNYTNHMIDVPRVPIFINAYNDQPFTIDLLIQKIMGNSPFRGSFEPYVWCNKWDTRF